MKALFLTISFFITYVASAQKDTVSGNAYRYIQVYEENKPFLSGLFIFKKKDKEIVNAYKLMSVSDIASEKELKFGIWIIDCDSSFYLNIYRYGYGFPKCFVKFEKKGNYYYFKAPPLMSANQQRRITNSQIMYGVIGAGITANKIKNENVNKRHNVFNFSRGTIRNLTVEYIADLLADYPQLLEEFNNEKEKEKIKTLKIYLEKINNEL